MKLLHRLSCAALVWCFGSAHAAVLFWEDFESAPPYSSISQTTNQWVVDAGQLYLAPVDHPGWTGNALVGELSGLGDEPYGSVPLQGLPQFGLVRLTYKTWVYDTGPDMQSSFVELGTDGNAIQLVTSGNGRWVFYSNGGGWTDPHMLTNESVTATVTLDMDSRVCWAQLEGGGEWFDLGSRSFAPPLVNLVCGVDLRWAGYKKTADLDDIMLESIDYNASFVCSFKLGDYIGDPGYALATIEVYRNGRKEEHHLTGLDQDARCEIATIGPGPAVVKAKLGHWLRQSRVVTLADSGTVVEFEPINGDVDGDNAITVFDYNALSSAFDSTMSDENWNPDADLDGDGAVTVFDYNILSLNFDLVGD